MLEAEERDGVPISYGCSIDSYGQCKVAVASGKVYYSKRTNYKCPPVSYFTCSCLPDGYVVLVC